MIYVLLSGENMNAKQKPRWVSIGILREQFDRLKELIIEVGCPSVSEYVRQAISEKEKYDRELLEERIRDIEEVIR